MQDSEAGDVEVEVAFTAADVIYCYAVGVFGVVALGLAGWGFFDVVVWRTPVLGRCIKG